MKVSGLTTFKKVKEKRLGLMELNMLANIKTGRSTDMEFTNGQTGVNLKEIGKKTK